jgi:hypothetical protein
MSDQHGASLCLAGLKATVWVVYREVNMASPDAGTHIVTECSQATH